ncbi:secretoglobin family 2B member 20-like isoform X1 [Mus pahari]|uniref:ABPBGU n=1 Tax=Mus pahari TaxID=10093 RepID=A0A7S5GIG1_MUSPA|nr:secretoglobin family 2B member 20-like isoform X1 [Mus pahari]QGX48216.1 ABPBGU [Mus pahari]
MKETLLLLALLVTGDLSFQTTEARVPFFKGYSSVVSGKRSWLYKKIQAYYVTAGEKVTFEKFQDCYKEGGLRTIFLEPKIMEAMLVSPECQALHSSEDIRTISDLLSKLLEE